MNILEEFQTRAKTAGLSDEQIQSFVAENLQPNIKVAEETLDTALDQFLGEVGVEKTAENKAYVEGFMNSAMASGMEPEEAVTITKQALALIFPDAAVTVKQASATLDPETASYLGGVLEKAASIGLTEDQTLAILIKEAGPLGKSMAAGIANAAPVAAKAKSGIIGLLKSLGLLGGGAALGGTAHSMMAPEASPPGMDSIIPILKRYAKTNPDAAAGGLGAVGGAALGALSGDDEQIDPETHRISGGTRLRNAGIGSMMGLGTGLGASTLNPDMFKQLVA